MRIDGEVGDRISALDRGLLYGDGLFETLAVTNGLPSLWGRHLERLRGGCLRLGIPMPHPRWLLDEVLQEIGGRGRGVVKLLLTRGIGGRGYRPSPDARPRLVVAFHPWPDYPDTWGREGVRVRFCRTRLGENPALAGMKHLNRLEQVLARAEWDDPDIAEGLMLDLSGRVVEGTMTNLFLVDGHGLVTPGLERCGVAGVMRSLVFDLAAELGYRVRVRDVVNADLRGGVALFLTNSLIGLWPVRELEGRPLDVAGVPADLRRALMDRAFEA